MVTIVEVHIEGVSPLIVNRFHEDAQAEASSGYHSRKEPLSKEDDAKNRLYFAEGIGTYLPAENLRQSIIAASARHKVGRRSASTDMAAGVYIMPLILPLGGEWQIDSRPVVIPATKGRIVRHRPIFETWGVDFKLQVDERLIDVNLARRILDDAGDYSGVGDFRPARKGPYGRYRVDKWEVIQSNGNGRK